MTVFVFLDFHGITLTLYSVFHFSFCLHTRREEESALGERVKGFPDSCLKENMDAST